MSRRLGTQFLEQIIHSQETVQLALSGVMAHKLYRTQCKYPLPSQMQLKKESVRWLLRNGNLDQLVNRIRYTPASQTIVEQFRSAMIRSLSTEAPKSPNSSSKDPKDVADEYRRMKCVEDEPLPHFDPKEYILTTYAYMNETGEVFDSIAEMNADRFKRIAALYKSDELIKFYKHLIGKFEFQTLEGNPLGPAHRSSY